MGGPGGGGFHTSVGPQRPLLPLLPLQIQSGGELSAMAASVLLFTPEMRSKTVSKTREKEQQCQNTNAFVSLGGVNSLLFCDCQSL